MAVLLSVNVARPHPANYTDDDLTGIDKRPMAGPASVTAPGLSPMGERGPVHTAGSGVAGDSVYFRGHGGDHQAVYAYAREDLDAWAEKLDRELTDGMFGENMTTSGLDVSGARIGERWRVGSRALLEVTSPRIPCRTFAGWIGEKQWVKRFTRAARPGAYLRVVTPGDIQAGDAIEVVSRPAHEVSVELLFRAMTTERGLLPQVLPATDAMNPLHAQEVRERLKAGDQAG
ncbi:MAG TPA: MOSC domain-containing protein [Trebonia sp.]